ncbi:MAG: type II toxin-antitoxin system PemK/MazF family toxin [Promicromonosporaceae bacterium]|nr:type II toxin-antitoxin system PemK/MazF family toxin [Promicromonosporaceae bacterium]
MDFGTAKRGHEQRGKRYGIVVSPTDFPLSVATIIPTSTSATPGIYRPVIDFGLGPTLALIDQMRAIDVNYIGEIAGYLTRDVFAEVEQAMSQYLGIIPMPE